MSPTTDRRDPAETDLTCDVAVIGAGTAGIAAERAARRPAPSPPADLYARAAAELRALPVLGTLAIDAVEDEFVVLLARAGVDGTVDVIKRVEGKSLVDGIVRRAA